MMTAFVAIAGGLGAISVVSILDLRGQLQEERAKASAASSEATAACEEVLALRDEVEERASEIDREVEEATGALWQRTEEELADLRAAVEDEVDLVEGEAEEALDALWFRVETELNRFQDVAGKELTALRAETNAMLGGVRARVEEVAGELQDIGGIFNRVALEETGVLNGREQQLLVLLAGKTDADNPAYAFNRASWALRFGRYSEAVRLFDEMLGATNQDESLVARARALRAQAKEYEAAPPKLVSPVPSGMFVNGIDLLALPLATLNALVQSGLLTVAEGQALVDSLPRQTLAP
jgi:tetratricopeptide (TPR) repeat protein